MLSSTEGLSQNTVQTILQDKIGFIWVGTADGLNKYDGYKFKIHRHDSEDPYSITYNDINALELDEKGNIWVGTYGGGLNKYDPISQRFSHYRIEPGNPNSLINDYLTCLYLDGKGVLWIGTSDGLSSFDLETETFNNYRNLPGGDPDQPDNNGVQTIYEDRTGRLWIGTRSKALQLLDRTNGTIQQFKHTKKPTRFERINAILEDSQNRLWIGSRGGLLLFNPINFEFQEIPYNSHKLETLNIQKLLEDKEGNIWIGTNRSGVYRLDGETNLFHRIVNDSPFVETALSHSIRVMFKDKTDLLWIGTDGGGIRLFPLNTGIFRHYKPTPNASPISRANSIRSFSETPGKGIWVATGGGGLVLLDRQAGEFKTFEHDPSNPSGISDNYLSYVYYDKHHHKLWVGMWETGLDIFDLNTEEFVHYEFNPLSPDRSLSQNDTRAITGNADTIWIATSGGGLNQVDPETLQFMHYRHDPNDPGSLSSDRLMTLLLDRSGNLWVGSDLEGLNRLNAKTAKFQRFQHDRNRPDSLSNNCVYSIFECQNGYIWVGTLGGLGRLTPSLNSFKNYRARHGLPNEVVYGIQEDRQGNLWLSTNKGLARFTPSSETFRSYNTRDGLQDNEFNINAFYTCANGEMLFGGGNGFNLFKPEDIRDNPHPPDVVITNFLLFNQTTQLRRNNPDSPLEKPIWATDALTLTHTNRVIGIEFAALHYADPSKNRYAYMLEGFDADWITTTPEKRFSTYTNLTAGDYVFKVKGGNKDDVWSQHPATLRIKMLPPPWQTWWAYVLYLLSACLVIVFYIRSQRIKLAQERAVVQRLKQIDNLKNEFLAKTSHELRTPLNGIIGLAESLIDGATGKLAEKTRANLSMIVLSGKRLANLVNDILDFSKLRNESLQLNQNRIDTHTLADVVITMTRPLLKGKDLKLVNLIPENSPYVSADESRLQQILYNLIGNAIKFTEKGWIQVMAEREGDNMLAIAVSDTGIGISKLHLDKIFGSFEHADETIAHTHGGAGLGLAITKKLVMLHGGDIHVNSTPGEGSTFRFTLPIAHAASKRSEPAVILADKEKNAPSHVLTPIELEFPSNTTGAFTILVVDDDPVNRQVLINHLSLQQYRILEAADGQTAIQQVLINKEDIHLILLDIMMPRITGYEVCRKLREHYTVSELPIIFLSAKNQSADLVAGFASGANDYLTKPIAKSELLARVNMHLEILELNRNLELKVKERTHALERKNEELKTQYDELETLNKIVRTINREVELKKVIKALLHQIVHLFPGITSGCMLLRGIKGEKFKMVGMIGPDFQPFHREVYTEQQLKDKHLSRMKEVETGIYLRDPSMNEDEFMFPKNLPLISLSISLNHDMVGLMILTYNQSIQEPAGMDTGKLLRFREHAVSALDKARTIKNLIETRRELVEAARTAGMAEIATNVLHNLGNTLNSVKVSAHTLWEMHQQQQWLELLGKTIELLCENTHRGAEFFQNDSRARKLPHALKQIHAELTKKESLLAEEVDELMERIQSVTDLLMEQHKYTHIKGLLPELGDLNETVREALAMERVLRLNKAVAILETYDTNLPPVMLEKTKCLRVLSSLLENAWEAVKHLKNGRISLATGTLENQAWVSISDNGGGIPTENLGQVFAQGFTTKETRGGSGLHYCANAMKEMSGSIELSSKLGKGTTVKLLFPLAGQQIIEAVQNTSANHLHSNHN